MNKPIDLKQAAKDRNAWIWENRGKSRAFLSVQTGLSESRIKHILTQVRRDNKLQKELANNQG